MLAGIDPVKQRIQCVYFFHFNTNKIDRGGILLAQMKNLTNLPFHIPVIHG